MLNYNQTIKKIIMNINVVNKNVVNIIILTLHSIITAKNLMGDFFQKGQCIMGIFLRVPPKIEEDRG